MNVPIEEIMTFQVVVRIAGEVVLLELTDREKQLLLNFVPVVCGGTFPTKLITPKFENTNSTEGA